MGVDVREILWVRWLHSPTARILIVPVVVIAVGIWSHLYGDRRKSVLEPVDLVVGTDLVVAGFATLAIHLNDQLWNNALTGDQILRVFVNSIPALAILPSFMLAIPIWVRGVGWYRPNSRASWRMRRLTGVAIPNLVGLLTLWLVLSQVGQQ
jgi:hypothetical protein